VHPCGAGTKKATADEIECGADGCTDTICCDAAVGGGATVTDDSDEGGKGNDKADDTAVGGDDLSSTIIAVVGVLLFIIMVVGFIAYFHFLRGTGKMRDDVADTHITPVVI
jgi:hypothetical protein